MPDCTIAKLYLGWRPSHQAPSEIVAVAFQVEAQEVVMGAMKEVFHLHGATPMASTGLGIAPLDFPADAVSMLAADGSPWGLRYDLRYPFAAWLARQAALPGTSTSCCFCFCMCCAILSSYIS